jgi:hypothetical protein
MMRLMSVPARRRGDRPRDQSPPLPQDDAERLGRLSVQRHRRAAGGDRPRLSGFVYLVWAMVATEVSVTTIFFNSLWGQSSLFFQAILSVGKPVKEAAPQRA